MKSASKKKTTRPIDDLVPVRSRETLSRTGFDGNVAILHLNEDDCYYGLDSIAAEFWSLIDGNRSISKIKSMLVKKHEPPLKKFEVDVSKLIADLKKHQLISFAAYR